MFSDNRGKVLAGLLLGLLLVVVMMATRLSAPLAQSLQARVKIMAQSPPPPGGPGMPPSGFPMPPGPMGPPPPGMPQGPPPGWMMPPPPMTGGSAAITAAEGYVYVVQGNTLYKFSASNLKLVSKVDLVPRLAGQPGGPGAMPGMPGPR